MPAEEGRPRDACATGDAVMLLALFLWREAGGEAVRTREALAAVVANQVRRMRQERRVASVADERGPAAALFLECLDAQPRPPAAERPAPAPDIEDPIFASCLRIAGRAVAGALGDPTGGASRWHRVGGTPEWSRGLTLGLLIGPFLFYCEPAVAKPISARL